VVIDEDDEADAAEAGSTSAGGVESEG